MLWKRNCPKIGFGIFSLVFVCALLCSFFLDTTSVSAVSDYSLIIDDSNYSSLNVPCSSDCSSYHYLLVSDMTPYNFVYQISIFSDNSFARLVATHGQALGSNLSFLLFSFDNADQFVYAGANWTTGTSFKITLSENNPFGSPPSGSLSISQNGTYDVTNYAEAVVDVPAEVIPGDYHNDLVSIYNAILICAATCLVIYFFYCIYRMIIKSTGGK